jgi:hypothetical protein
VDSKDPNNASKFEIWRDRIEKLVAYLIKVMPGSLSRKSTAGYTPLFLAFSLGRHTLAKMLLAAGADPTTRDNNGNNVIHGLLQHMPSKVRPDDHKTLQKMLELLDPALRQEMMLERNAYHCGANTPLHSWLSRNIRELVRSKDEKNELGCLMLRTLLGLSNGKELYMVDGSGNTPVHGVVQVKNLNYLSIMLEAQPACIWRENAVGRTPAELAMSSWLQTRVATAPAIDHQVEYQHLTPWHMQSMVNRKPEGFVEKATKGEKSLETLMWEMCQECMKAAPSKRKLISLSEANEVAKRLAATEAARRRRYRGKNEDEDDEDEEQKNITIHDEVCDWYGQSEDVW